MSSAEKTRLGKPKTKRGERILKEREPQLVRLSSHNPRGSFVPRPLITLHLKVVVQVEELKKILLVYGSKPSQVVQVSCS